MEISHLLTANLFVHGALAFYVIGFLVRDEILLRLLILIGSMLYILYYYYISDTPLWDAIWASAVIGLTNIVMIGVIWYERSTIGMSPSLLSLYRYFPTLNPGQFRRIMREASWHVAQADTKITIRSHPLDHLYFITKGDVSIERQGRSSTLKEGNFIGEISFLIGGDATATITVPKGGEYVAWDRDKLETLMRKSLKLSNALNALFNIDIARKLAISTPEHLDESASPQTSH